MPTLLEPTNLPPSRLGTGSSTLLVFPPTRPLTLSTGPVLPLCTLSLLTIHVTVHTDSLILVPIMPVPVPPLAVALTGMLAILSYPS